MSPLPRPIAESIQSTHGNAQTTAIADNSGTSKTNQSSIDYAGWMAHLRHELYTPLNAIQGYSELLLEEIEDVQAQADNSAMEVTALGEQLSQIRAENENLVRTIGQGLSLDFFCLSEGIKTSDSEIQQHVQQWLNSTLTPLAEKIRGNCNQLSSISPDDFLPDVEKITQAAHHFAVLSQGDKLPTAEAFSGSAPQTEVSLSLEGGKVDESQAQSPLAIEQAHILIVDNIETNRDLLRRHVERQGHYVTEAGSGSEALKFIPTGAFDLILLDVLMPGINGYQVLSWLRTSEWQHLPVIMISSLDEIDSTVKCIEMGAEDYLSKPFNPVLLKARVDACLEKKRLRDQEILYRDRLADANHEIRQLNQRLSQENSRLSAELAVTQKLQQMILPKEKELAEIEDLEIAGFMTPAEDVGGDYYDVIRYGDSIRIGIGDVTGHGLESGVLMLMVQTTIRTLIESGETEQAKILDVVNRTIFHNIQRMETDKNLTLALVDYREGHLRISGQHEEVLIFPADGEMQRIDTLDLGFPIGLEEEIVDFISQIEVTIAPGDIVVLYTDGVTEAESHQGDFYGIERMCDLIHQHREQAAIDIRDAVIKDLYSHVSSSKIHDDITLLVLKRKS